jgi:hypothetical protein
MILQTLLDVLWIPDCRALETFALSPIRGPNLSADIQLKRT